MGVKKLAIIGKMYTKMFAPYKDMNFEIWQVNWHNPKLQRVDKIVDLHENGNRKADINFDNFPFEECHKILGGNYFNNTVPYLIVYAYMQGFDEIYFYGCKFTSYQEVRKKQLKNVRELITWVREKGVKVYAPYDLELLNNCNNKPKEEYPLYINWSK